MTGAIDLFVNPNMSAALADPKMRELLMDVKKSYFKGDDGFFRDETPENLIKTMDEAGIRHSVLMIDPEDPKEWICEFSRRHPDRFSLCAAVGVEHGMDAIWALEDLVARERVTLARMFPGRTENPPTHASFYPLYAKCAECDLTLSVMTGIPGPRIDAACHDPIHLDRICREFPMLRIIMTHGADPWWGVAIRLMLKYEHLGLMTSAWRPKYLPAELIHYMNTRGSDKIMFATDHPVLGMKRCLEEVDALPLRPGVKEKYLFQNAERFVLRARKPRATPRYVSNVGENP